MNLNNRKVEVQKAMWRPHVISPENLPVLYEFLSCFPTHGKLMRITQQLSKSTINLPAMSPRTKLQAVKSSSQEKTKAQLN